MVYGMDCVFSVWLAGVGGGVEVAGSNWVGEPWDCCLSSEERR